MDNFIWSGTNLKGKLHMVIWKVIVKPIDEGEMGILDTHSFNKELIINNLWRVVTKESIWGHLIREKYIQGIPFTLWLMDGLRRTNISSYIWQCMTKNRELILGFMRWEVGDEKMKDIGLNSLKVFHSNHSLLVDLITTLHNMGIHHIAEISKQNENTPLLQSWLNEDKLGLIN